jgi:5-methylthioadenosine/S-adenosylhomocysteine deaminase
VAVDDAGSIAYVGNAAGAPRGAWEHLGNSLLMPGIVNAHSHLQLTALRGLLPGTGFFEWIRGLVEIRSRFVDAELLRASAVIGIAEGLAAGITTYGDTADSDAPLHAMLHMGVRGTLYREVFGPDPAQCADAMLELRKNVERLRGLASRMVRVGVSPHAPYTVSDDLYRQVAGFGREHGLPVAVHIAESAEETEYVVRGEGPFAQLLSQRGIEVKSRARTPVELLRDTGVLEERPLLIHVVRISTSDIAAIAASGSPVVHCPVSNAKLGHGVAPVVELLGEGITVALGSDSVIANDRMDLLQEARLACLVQRAVRTSGTALGSAQLLQMLTLNGARALGIDGQTGSLDVGKRADITAFSLEGLNTTPYYEPHDTLIHSLAGAQAKFVMVDGRILLRDGRLLCDVSAERELVVGAGALFTAPATLYHPEFHNRRVSTNGAG